jgi:prevent-host-death family protein
MASWQVNEAKNRFSELIEEAQVKGPQIITRHGTERAVVLSIAEYRSLTAQVPDFKTFLLSIPKIDLELERDRDFGRDLDLFSDDFMNNDL